MLVAGRVKTNCNFLWSRAGPGIRRRDSRYRLPQKHRLIRQLIPAVGNARAIRLKKIMESMARPRNNRRQGGLFGLDPVKNPPNRVEAGRFAPEPARPRNSAVCGRPERSRQRVRAEQASKPRARGRVHETPALPSKCARSQPRKRCGSSSSWWPSRQIR